MNASHPISGRTRAVAAIHEARNDAHEASEGSFALAPRAKKTVALPCGALVNAFESRTLVIQVPDNSDITVEEALSQLAVAAGRGPYFWRMRLVDFASAVRGFTLKTWRRA